MVNLKKLWRLHVGCQRYMFQNIVFLVSIVFFWNWGVVSDGFLSRIPGGMILQNLPYYQNLCIQMKQILAKGAEGSTRNLWPLAQVW